MHSTLVMLPNSTESSSVAVLYGGLETSKSTIKVGEELISDLSDIQKRGVVLLLNSGGSRGTVAPPSPS